MATVPGVHNENPRISAPLNNFVPVVSKSYVNHPFSFARAINVFIPSKLGILKSSRHPFTYACKHCTCRCTFATHFGSEQSPGDAIGNTALSYTAEYCANPPDTSGSMLMNSFTASPTGTSNPGSCPRHSVKYEYTTGTLISERKRFPAGSM
jgi:hypothetical protein